VNTPAAVGDVCPPRRYTHSRLQLFRFSAVSWNSHRIHYDAEFAASEGFSDVVVQSTLHGQTLTRYALEWAGPDACLESVSWRNRRDRRGRRAAHLERHGAYGGAL
jgi:hydroxyacyl-ACP dehydratase HTD2-like protein with hotdog domain